MLLVIDDNNLPGHIRHHGSPDLRRFSLVLPYSKFPESSRRFCEFDAFGARSIPFRRDSETNETIETKRRDSRSLVAPVASIVSKSFQDGMDLIDITGIKGIKDFGQITEAMVQDGTGVDIALGDNDMLTIQNLTIDKLIAVDFAY
jgi:hypothetical protein